MFIELINTGSELMLGRVLNSHQQWLCRRLADLGRVVSRQVAVADTASEIEQAVRESLSRADLVITTGGLGPTSDDLTRDSIARLLGRKLEEDASTLDRIREYFAQRNRPMPASTRIQALIPEGAFILPNPNGTAPGLALEVNPNPYRKEGGSWLILLPGPPRELQPLFDNHVVPLLARAFPAQDFFVCRTIRTTGVGESVIQETIEPSLRELMAAGLEIGYCARPGQTDVRLTARGTEAEKTVAAAGALVQARLDRNVYGTADEELEEVLVRLLTERKQTLASAESCTGGSLANRLTNVPGASAVFVAGFVTYSNKAKEDLLGVRAETLARHGAVSEPVAREMAEGARRVSRADYALATTGIAGPGGGTSDKPVGTVFIALASERETRVLKMLNAWDRPTFKDVTTRQALNELRMLLAPV